VFCQLDRSKVDPVHLAVFLTGSQVVVIVQVDVLFCDRDKNAGKVFITKGIVDRQPTGDQVARIADADLAFNVPRIPIGSHGHACFYGGAAQQ